MKERPILFSAPMVRAIIEGKKTQTRRVIKKQPDRWDECGPYWEGNWYPPCPYGKMGDRLWVRETFGTRGNETFYRASPPDGKVGIFGLDGNKWKPSIHMPRSYSRISLEITGVRVERLQEISEGDAIAEGIDWNPTMGRYNCAGEYRYNSVPEYRSLWDSINKDMGNRWADNPWVWVVEFRRIKL